MINSILLRVMPRTIARLFRDCGAYVGPTGTDGHASIDAGDASIVSILFLLIEKIQASREIVSRASLHFLFLNRGTIYSYLALIYFIQIKMCISLLV